MKNNKSSHKDQEDAFFGIGSSSTNNRNGINRNESISSHQDHRRKRVNHSALSDEELALKLQQQYLENNDMMNRQKSQEERDLEFARRLQEQGSTESNDASNSNYNDSDIRRGYPASLSYGQEEERRRKMQEVEDAKIAKAMQEEEKSSGLFRGSLNEQRPNDVGGRNGRGGANRNGTQSLIPICYVCNKIVTFPLTALGNLYHKECFKCMACHQVIQPNERFAVTEDNGQKFPLHKACYADLYGLRCTVCKNTIESDSNGRISYVKHPFFEEVMCASHSSSSQGPKIRKCTGCHRFEPIGSDGFADLGDADRCVCYSCCRSVIVDSKDAKPLWDNIMSFFEQKLKLPIYNGMRDIPVLIVPHDALNSQLQHSNHQGSNQIMTRGLCLSEHQRGLNIRLPSLRFDRKAGSFAEERGHTYFEIPGSHKTNPNSTVTAILCLSGLPSDLSTSILAHEATHAWIKLHPSFDPSRPIPPQVEEGCCQLVAMIFLNDGLEPPSSQTSVDGPSDEKLRQYFKFSIETDTNEVYGEGFRKAANVYSQIGLEALLSHVVNYREFPNI